MTEMPIRVLPVDDLLVVRATEPGLEAAVARFAEMEREARR
ncbi:hypothetical protein [Amycolatopsis sp. FBCC-B4732]|nr:hypothetical protein [Amycolatopsis sp. FBCC-B4732]